MIPYILLKYWRKHIKSALAMLFAGVLLAAVVFIGLTIIREGRVEAAHSTFDRDGHSEVFIVDSNDEVLQKVTEGKTGYNYGFMQVYGEFDGFAYGTIEDEHDILHIPLTEGRMPETADEIAADKGVLDKLYWAGKCGDTIELDGKTYTVVGIIDEIYGKDRDLSSIQYPEGLIYKIPLIFVGKYEGEPLYRIDMLNNFLDLNVSEDAYYEQKDKYEELLREYENNNTIGWYRVYSERESLFFYGIIFVNFFMNIAIIGAIIAALSVFSILRSIFSERKSRIEILKRIGMSRRRIAIMYAVECAMFAVIQTILGIAFGFLAYEGVFKFRTEVLEQKIYSGITDLWFVISTTLDPFLCSAVISVTVVVLAYLLCIITDKIQYKDTDKNTEPRPLSKCFKQIFSHKTVTAAQIAALTLICFSVIEGYLYYTDNGKTGAKFIAYIPPSWSFTANGLEMEGNNIAEYYSSDEPTVNYIGDAEPRFPFIVDNFSAGIDDNTADNLPEYALPFGSLRQTLISREKQNFRYINEIDTASESFRQGLLALSDEEHQNFFDDGQLGSKYLYGVETKLTTSRVIESLSGNVTEGEINVDKLNSGEEIVVIYQGIKPPFEIGETISLNSISAGATGFGVGEISSAEVKIGALVKLPSDYDKKISSIVLSEREEYNFLTTAKGAESMGFPCAKYTGIYALEPMNGGLIPSSAKMTMKSLAIMQHDYLINQLIKYSSSIAILLVMSLLGFSAYFNGIGMKIRLKKYEISVLRAVGTNLKELKKKLLLESMKIPLISTIAAYVLIKIHQLSCWIAYNIIIGFEEKYFTYNSEPPTEFVKDLFGIFSDFAHKQLFVDGLMWQPNAEIPMLILFAVLCIVTFILTLYALRKFKSNIAGDLSEGRTRQ